MSETVDALAFALSQIGEPHRHQRHCIHNLSVDEQWEHRRINIGDRKATDEEMNQLGFYRENIVSITPDDWEVDAPDLDWSRFDEAYESVNNTYTVTLEVTADQPPDPDDFYIRWPSSINTVITSVKVFGASDDR